MSGPMNIFTSFERNGETIYVETDAWIDMDGEVDLDDLEECHQLTKDDQLIDDGKGDYVKVTLSMDERRQVAAKMVAYAATIDPGYGDDEYAMSMGQVWECY